MTNELHDPGVLTGSVSEAPPPVEEDEEAPPTGTLFFMMIFLLLMVGLWATVYWLLLSR